jgi:hypothetical protein
MTTEVASPSEVLLRICAGSLGDLESPGMTETLSRVVELAHGHEIDPFIVARLRTAVAGSALARGHQRGVLQERLDREFMRNAIQRSLLVEELARIESALDVPVVLLKGLALEGLAYDVGARLSKDIDLLVRPTDYEAARDALTAIGYAVETAYDEGWQRSHGKDIGLVRTDQAGRRWAVELHWRVMDPILPGLSVDEVFAASEEQMETGFRRPCLTHTMVILAANFRKHRFTELKTLCDLHLTISRDAGRIDWAAVHRTAHKAGVCISMRCSLDLIRQLFGSAVPSTACGCYRSRLPQAYLLSRIVTPTVVQQVESGEIRAPVSRLVPLLSLDRTASIGYLIAKRLAASPETASYEMSGAAGVVARVYPTRTAYILDLARKLAEAVSCAAAASKHRKHHIQISST